MATLITNGRLRLSKYQGVIESIGEIEVTVKVTNPLSSHILNVRNVRITIRVKDGPKLRSILDIDYMNRTFQDYLIRCVIVFIDDILV